MLACPQPVHGPGQRELGTAEPFDEVAAPHPAGVLHRAEHRIDPGEPTGKPLSQDGVAHDDPVSFQHLLGAGSGDLLGRRRGARVEEVGDEVPPTATGGRGTAGDVGLPRPPPFRPAPQERPQRSQRVVGDLAGPHEIPQRLDDRVGIASAGDRVEIAEERCPAFGEVAAEPLVDLAGRRVAGAGGVQQRDLVPEVERHPPVRRGDGAAPGPHDVAGGEQCVEVGRLVGHPSGKDGRLEGACRDRPSLQLADDLGDPVPPRRRVAHAVPGRHESGEDVGRHRFDVAAKHGERTTAEPA